MIVEQKDTMKACLPALVRSCVVFYRVHCFPSYNWTPYSSDSKSGLYLLPPLPQHPLPQIHTKYYMIQEVLGRVC